MIKTNKKELRSKILSIRNNLDKDEKQRYDKIIFEKLRKRREYINSKNIFIYLGYGSEIDTISLVKDMFLDDKNVCIPKTNIEDRTMEAVIIRDLDNLEEDKYGILEPKSNYDVIDKKDIELVIMPGVAFDNGGGRLGYGGGYYDKFLMDCSEDKYKIALAYDFQVIESVPKEDHDILVDCIITEKNEKNVDKLSE